MFKSLRKWTRSFAKEDGSANMTEVPPVQATLKMMDMAGVSRGLLSAWSSPSGPLISNQEVASFVKTSPSRLFGVAAVNLAQPCLDAVQELRSAVQDLGFVGLRLLPWLWELPCNHRKYYPLFAECVNLKIPFCLQVGHTGPLMPSEYGRPIPYVDDIAREFPDLVVVAGHIGYPWTNEMISLATKFDNVYIDTSAYTCQRYPQELVSFMRGHGRHKVMFGSNYPMISPLKCLEHLDTLGLDQEARQLFLSGNAQRVFRLPVDKAKL